MRRNPPLSVAYILSRLTVDLERGECFWLDATKHHKMLNGKLAGSKRTNSCGKQYWCIKIDGHAYRRSQLILAVSTGIWPIEMVDHIDGNSLNDTATNLRHATATENAQNLKKRKKNSPLPMGVRLLPSGKYHARITNNKKQITIGTFETVGEAVTAYQAARREYFHAFH